MLYTRTLLVIHFIYLFWLSTLNICSTFFFFFLLWNAKVGSQEIAEVTGKIGLGVQNEAGQRLTEFCQKNALVIANTLLKQHKRRLYTWTSPDGQYQNQTDYILCSQDGEALYSHQKQDWELTVAQIMNSLLQNSDLR